MSGRTSRGRSVYIVGTTRDDRKRLFTWPVAGDGPDNTWTVLAAVVDANLAKPERDHSAHDLIRIQAALLEEPEGAAGAPPL